MKEALTLASLQDQGLEHLFDFDLNGSGGEPYVSAKDRDGPFIGNATGTVTGGIQGTVKISFFAKDCAYLLVQAGIDPGPGQHLCKENEGGIIETDDGAKILFDTRGYGLRGADPAFPRKWRLAMTAQFSTIDRRYKWLNRSFGFLEGLFDEEAGLAHFRGYVRRER